MSKIAITGAATGTATFTIESPATSTNRTLTIPDATTTIVGTDATQTLTNKSMVATQLTGTIAAARLPAGSVLQVVGGTSTSTVTNATTTDADLLTVSITPSSASNKILVIASLAVQIIGGSNAYARVVIYRGVAATGTLLQRQFWGTTSNVGNFAPFCLCQLDSPSTTSAQNYSLSFALGSGGTDSVNTDGQVYTLTLMEIAG